MPINVTQVTATNSYPHVMSFESETLKANQGL